MSLFVFNNNNEINEAIASDEIDKDLGINPDFLGLADAALFGYSNDVYSFKPGVFSRYIAPMSYRIHENLDENELYFLVSKDNWVPWTQHARNIVKYDLAEIIYGHKGTRLPSAFLFLEPDLKAAAKDIKKRNKNPRNNATRCNSDNCVGCQCLCDTQLDEILSHFPGFKSFKNKYQKCEAVQYLHSNGMIPFQMSLPFINKPAVIGILGKRPSPEAVQLAEQRKVVTGMSEANKNKISKAITKRQNQQPPNEPPLAPGQLAESTNLTTLQQSAAAVKYADTHNLKKHDGFIGSPNRNGSIAPDQYSPSPNKQFGFSRRRQRRRTYLRY